MAGGPGLLSGGRDRERGRPYRGGDRPRRRVWIEDCVELSRFIESRLSREEEDYELEVGSAGIGQPFKVLQQYVNHVGSEVDVLTADGRKLHGVLTAAGPEDFEVTMKVKKKLEGEKRPRLVDEAVTLRYTEVKYTKYSISFK